MDTVETLKTLCFDTLLYHPDETLISLCIHHSNEIFELIQLYGNQAIPADISVEVSNSIITTVEIQLTGLIVVGRHTDIQKSG